VAETRKLAAILVSGVVGYSRLAGSDEDRNWRDYGRCGAI
jgi:class 3 adenylate cyclase